jgi:ActR/RegA family two-component response regulator
VEGAVSLAEKEIDAELVRSLLGSPSPASPEPLDLAAVERRHIARILKLTAGNKTEAARLLGLDRKTLQRKGF